VSNLNKKTDVLSLSVGALVAQNAVSIGADFASASAIDDWIIFNLILFNF